MSLRLHKLVATYELDPIEMGDYQVTFRIDVFQSNGLYSAKVFRYDFYRLQPFQQSEDDSEARSDEEILVREIAVGARIETFRESSEPKLMKKIAGVFREAFGHRVITDCID